MNNYLSIINILIVTIFGGIMAGCTVKEVNEKYRSDHYKNGKFVNKEVQYKPEPSEIPGIFWDIIFNKSKEAIPKEKIPVTKLTKKDLLGLDDYSVIRLSHSTLLYKLEGEFILTDPIFSQRVAPFSFLAPKRFHENPIEIEELPPIKVVIISHDHYDHLDENSIKKLNNKVEKFYTTLGVGKILESFGVDKNKITELDWWQSIDVGNIKLTATPTQHFSGRSLFNNDETLWSSWVIKAPKANLYFGADSGYFEEFKKIGKEYGPFDMTFLEVGAYNEKWLEVHMMPEESVQAHIDLQAKVMFPIHNGTFDLGLHSWREPFERVDSEAEKKNVSIVYPKMGEAISLIKENNTSKWWN
ncbi:MAG: MBL fold metallo-hydrolase [Sulfurimonadaceae bacterium]